MELRKALLCLSVVMSIGLLWTRMSISTEETFFMVKTPETKGVVNLVSWEELDPTQEIDFVHFNILYDEFQPIHLCAVENMARILASSENKDPVQILVWLPHLNQIRDSEFADLVSSLETLGRHSREVKINFVDVDIVKFFLDTPLEELFGKEISFNNAVEAVNRADGFRLVTLYRYGGLYLDLDFFIINDPTVLPDGIAEELPYRLNNAAIRFRGEHKQYAWDLMVKFKETFSNTGWGTQGPVLFTNFFVENNTEDRDFLSKFGMQLYDAQDIYPVDYNHRHTFKTNYTGFQAYRKEFKKRNKKDMMLLHMWHRRSARYEMDACSAGLDVYLKSFAGGLREKYCPEVLEIMKRSQLLMCTGF